MFPHFQHVDLIMRMAPTAGIAVVIDTTGDIRAPRNGNANSRRHPLPHV
jgi:hypothetical protein